MTIYLVMVRAQKEEYRYCDSLWVVEKHAHDRVMAIRAEFERRGFNMSAESGYWWVWVSEARAPDGELSEPHPADDV